MLLLYSPSPEVASWVNYSSRRTESSSEHFDSDLSFLKADALWCENKQCSDSNPWPIDPKASVLPTTPQRLTKVNSPQFKVEYHLLALAAKKYISIFIMFIIIFIAQQSVYVFIFGFISVASEKLTVVLKSCHFYFVLVSFAKSLCFIFHLWYYDKCFYEARHSLKV